jgi:hypothetical protein
MAISLATSNVLTLNLIIYDTRIIKAAYIKVMFKWLEINSNSLAFEAGLFINTCKI